MRPNNRMHLTDSSGLRPLPPAGDAERWTSPAARGDATDTQVT